MTSFGIISYQIFGNFSKKYSSYFQQEAESLKKADMDYSVEEWLSVCISIFLISFLISLPLSLVFFGIASKNILASIPFSIISGIVLSLTIGFITLKYPLQVIATKKKKIDNSLHFATIYLGTLARTGMPPYKIFNVLSNFKEFGEIRKVAQKIVKDMEIFGFDFLDSLKRNADKAPTGELKDLLYGMRSTIESGGNLKVYLSNRGDSLTNNYKRKLEEYVKTLSLFLEIYITVVIVGSVFVIVLTTIMSILGGNFEQIRLIQLLLLTIVLPAISCVFIVILKTISPTEV